MTCEKEDVVLLSHNISMEDIYQLQNGKILKILILESLIVWSDLETKVEMALSFQSSDGCQQFWDEMRMIQGRNPDSKEIIASKSLNTSKTLLEEKEEKEDSQNLNYVNLPNIEPNALPSIIDLMIIQTKESVANTLIDNDHILLDKLIELFHQLEESKDFKDLTLLFEVFKLISKF